MTDIAATADPLWTRARAMFARAVAAIGDAAAIATLPALSRRAYRRVLGWLSLLEHVVRKLLLAEAAEINRAVPQMPQKRSARPPAALQVRAAPRARPEAARSNDISRPQTWPLRFSLLLPRPPRRIAHMRRAPPSRALTEQEECFRLASRLEALRRVLDDPRRHAERLARILARQVRRRRDVVQRYWWRPARTDMVDPADPRLSIDVYGACFAAPYAFDSS